MKVITSCIISLETLEIISETFYEYLGPIARCGGGGGSAGTVDYPAYMKSFHNSLLDHMTSKTSTACIIDTLNAGLGLNPWDSLTPVSPDTDLAANAAAVTAFAAKLAGISDTFDWSTLFRTASDLISPSPSLLIGNLAVDDKDIPGDLIVPDMEVIDDLVVEDIPDTGDIPGIDEIAITTDVGAFASNLDDEIESKILPRFRRGMQDINAVVSSAFPVGEAIIEAFRNRDVAKHDSSLRLAAANKNIDVGLENERLHLDVDKANVTKVIEVGRTNITKNIEINKTNLLKRSDIGKTNLDRSLDVVKTNLSKDIEVGKANLMKDIQVGEIVAKTDIEYKRMYLEGSSQMLRLMMQRITWEDGYARMVIEANRIKIVALGEEYEATKEVAVSGALWDPELYQYANNVLAAIAGASTVTKGISRAASVLGGAMSGAGAGAQIGAQWGSSGGPIGAGVGAGIGALAGWLGSR